MPANKIYCFCSRCGGQLRDPKTFKKHAIESAANELAAVQALVARKEEQMRRVKTRSAGEQFDDNGMSVGSDEITGDSEASTAANHDAAPQTADINMEVESDTDQELLPPVPPHNPDLVFQPHNNAANLQVDPDINLGFDYGPINHDANERLRPDENHEIDLDYDFGPNVNEPHLDDVDLDYDDESNVNVNRDGPPSSDSEIEPEEDYSDDIPPATQASSRIENIKISQAFIEYIKNATLYNGELDDSTIERIQNPDTHIIDLSDKGTRLSLKLYKSCMNASEAIYNSVRKDIMKEFPDEEILSYHLARKLIADISGVVSISDDMCVNSCHAFTGPFKNLEFCSICSEPRYSTRGRSRKPVPRKQATTFPIGPQIQALRRSVDGAHDMEYLDRKINEMTELDTVLVDGLDGIIDDILCGDDVRNRVIGSLNITSDDTLVIFSCDGARLYKDKESDTWIGIWIIVNYDPVTRYRKKHVLPAFTVPGPQKPKNLDSYLFRSFHHLSAIQRENNGAGMHIFNAAKNAIVLSRTILLAATADAVGLVELDGRVGHHGALGCRKGCPMKGRHKPSSGHYFAAHLRPYDNPVADCDHPDFDFRNFPFQLEPDQYEIHLAKVVNSMDELDYKRNRKETGISKPSILSGLHPLQMLPIPLCFTVDLMHLFGLNAGELLISLWRGTIKCEPTDNKATWDWATSTGDNWISLGNMVAAATKYFPSSFHRPPRNPAEKISSGYKATEYYHLVFGLGPAFFRIFLPAKYWKSYCKLVRGTHIVMQRKTSVSQVKEAHRLFIQFVEEYENLYYQRRADRIHFNRPCFHTILHTAPEILRLGNGCHTDQYTMERAIGDLGNGIRQPSNPFANLSQVALRQAQMNAMKSICPELDEERDEQLPRYSCDLGQGYALLRPREKIAREFSAVELTAIREVCEMNKRQKWGRLLLPNGQIARSLYSESNRNSMYSTRISRNIKLTLNGKPEFAEVQFYFLDRDNDEPGEPISYAVVSIYGPPNERMLEESSHTLHACEYKGQDNIHCIKVTDILSVVSMQPLPRLPDDPENLWFVIEKSGLDDVQLFTYQGED